MVEAIGNRSRSVNVVAVRLVTLHLVSAMIFWDQVMILSENCKQTELFNFGSGECAECKQSLCWLQLYLASSVPSTVLGISISLCNEQ